jgi:hypothetical protein
LSPYDGPPKTRRAARAVERLSKLRWDFDDPRLGAELERDLQLVAGRDIRALRSHPRRPVP